MEQVYTPKQDYKVLVNCMTYNQSKYIEDALNGFAMQKTDFPFVCLVMDDASTDGEQEVIKAWMERECDMEKAENVEIEKSFITLVPHKSNPNCAFAFYFLKENLFGTGKKTPLIASWRERCEYEAICEGDDYWTDSIKLKKQVDCLELYPTVGMCYTQCRYYYQDKGVFASNSWGGDAEKFETLIQSNSVPTASVMYRRGLYELYDDDVNPREKGWMLGDYPLWLWISKEYGVKFINEETCTYRVLKKSASHRDDRSMREAFIISVCNIQRFFADKYNQSELISGDKAGRSLLMDAYSNKDYKAVVHFYSQITNPEWRDVIKYIISKIVLSIK